MPIEICTVSGYSEFGKNMTAVRYGNEAVIIDMGIHPENYIKFTEDEEDLAFLNAHALIKAKAIPDVNPIGDWTHMVKAIIPGHAHLDHCGAVPYLAERYNAPVICTPFTAEVIKSMIKDRDMAFKNKIEAVQPNSTKKVSEKISVEFIHTTHSTPQASMVAVHTPEGTVLYASDFKFDESPLLGKPPNMKRLKALGQENVTALIIESTYGDKPGRTPSEAVAREMLKDAIYSADSKKNAIIVTTFSSHIARLKSILEIGEKHGRKVVFLGRSMAKYIAAAEKAGLTNLSKKAEVIRYGNKVERRLKEMQREGKQKYLLVCTGHQGEPKSVLSRIITQNFLDTKDYVIFSCRVIPTPTNKENRERLERELKRLGVHVLVDVHQSGHASQDELRELIELVKPKNIIPSHGEEKTKKGLMELAALLGYKQSQLHMAKDGAKITV
ncbi:RNase J family beta-CASP ribonuclease [Candidatus Woesearchaeota archaeon]|nr:RNase J family beta-CASP ribonuclease [Candidatus Woesearchaeota archaeon]